MKIMVFESLINHKTAEKKPMLVFFMGFFYVSISIILCFFVFPSSPSMPVIFFTALACTPFMVRVIKYEQKETEEEMKHSLIGDHRDIFLVYSSLFLGFVFAFVLWFLFLPSSVSSLIFEAQIETINNITGKAVSDSSFWSILLNNFKVLALCVLFSFLYGAGAVFILSWNASVISTAIANLIRTKIALLGFNLTIIPMSFLRYFLHGIPELFAYLIGGIAGGIISAVIIRENSRKVFFKMFFDAIDLIIIAFLLLILGALIEVGVSPIIMV